MYEVYVDKESNEVYFSRKEVEATNLAFGILGIWEKLYIREEKIYLTKLRCKELNVPVKPSEEFIGFYYTTSGPGIYKYLPVYDRTEYNLNLKELNEEEIVKPI
ncbi:hypothetical protein ABEY96_28875 [Priestia aryabhattai]|uniref:hypothetical protein n=1 Tax=Priestia aryabhattai TaxID=412384 RepID=UPI003D29DF1F